MAIRWLVCLTVLIAACEDEPKSPTLPPLPVIDLTYSETRDPCEDRTPLRKALFGDLHVHTRLSFDAGAYGNLLHPADAYAFARGAEVDLPVLHDGVRTTQKTQIDRPLDFLAVTDHGDLLGEVARCTDPLSPVYDLRRCVEYRHESGSGSYDFGVMLATQEPERDPTICGVDQRACDGEAAARWAELRQAADDAYDRTGACELTAFVGYEYTNTRGISNLHRNVIFRNNMVPTRPVSFFEAPDPIDLWRELDAQCIQSDDGCDVLVLPHNSNLSNGHLFFPTYRGAETLEEEADIARLRARMEPVVEIFQHKGDSECRNGFPGIEDDPACTFEKLRYPGDVVCAEETPGFGGMRLTGCVHRLDFVRNALLTGLAEATRLGVNPYRLGFIGSTDTHNGTPGHVATDGFPGHVGIVDGHPGGRLGPGNATHDGIINNPGGLAGVWAVENSRDAVFNAIRRGETFATSGPRMTPRLFGGWAFEEGLCDNPHRLRHGYAEGVPSGGRLGERPAEGTPRLFVETHKDPMGIGLQRVQVVKGWVNADGSLEHRVYDVAGDATAGADYDSDSCAEPTAGVDRLCAVWSDPDFDPSLRAFYYTRTLAVPACRWSHRECSTLPEADRPVGCESTEVEKMVQHRAWASPIWYVPSKN